MANTQKVMTLADTAKLIAKVHANAAKGVRFEYDGTKGEYGNIAAYFAAHKDGKVYGVRFPKYTYSNTPTGVKTRDNANLTIEISTNAKAGRDDYAALPAFRTWDVNATVDDDGVPHVTAIDGIDTRFKRDGSNGDVYVMTCPGYYKLESTSTHNEFLYSDTQYDGYAPLPGVLLPDGSKRPCLLFAKYAASLDSQQRPLSVSGKEIDREFGSQNRAIDYALKKGKGYAGRCAGDTFYVQLMLMLKYATKNSDVLGGCWQYTPQTAVTKAETGVKRVIIATSYANNFDVGSTVNVGTDKERNNTGNYSAARARTILSKTAIDASNTALNLDGDAITTTTACFVSSMPWKTGATDKLLGTDGRPSTASAANHQPIRLQGIELFNGIYESDADLIANAVKDNDNLGRIELYRVFDITKASKTSTANYTKIGEFTARDKTTNDSWRYAEDFTLSNGVIIPTGLNATSTTGMCDAIGANPLTSQGLRQVPRFGGLGDGAACGAFAANLRNDLANRRWNIGGRISGTCQRIYAITPQLPSTPASERASHGPAENQTEHPAGRRTHPAPSNAGIVQIGNALKTHCKHTRCATPMFVRRAIDHYLKGKRSRRDVTRFLETHPDLDRLAERIADEIREGRYRDTRITYFNRVEPISGKHRVIGRESVRHQIYDHVAVMALQPLFDAKVGRWQTASIPNRGTIDARRAIKRWTRERSSKWFVKLDVRKYYPSIDRPTLKAMLTRDVGDPILLRLVFHLIDRYQGDNGLNIGSYLSQWLANYYLSHAYHWIESPAMTIERTSRRTGEITRRRLITHQLWYMDDLLLIGTSKRDLKIAARRIVRYLKDALKLDVHEEWNCKRLDLEPIDMVGYTFRPHGRVNIRSGVFLRARRTFNRARRRPMTEQLARRCCSYYGYLRNSDSIRYRRRHRIDHTMRRATRYLSTQHRKENPCSRPYPASNPSKRSATTRAATASRTSASAATSPPSCTGTAKPHGRNTPPTKPTRSAT